LGAEGEHALIRLIGNQKQRRINNNPTSVQRCLNTPSGDPATEMQVRKRVAE
jgi:hypothetical protein